MKEALFVPLFYIGEIIKFYFYDKEEILSTSFPSGLDSFTNPVGTDYLDNPAHVAQHSDKNDAIESIEAKVGVDNSAVTTTIDYFLKHASGAYRTHTHDGTSDDGTKLDWDTCWSDAVHNHSANAEGGVIPEASVTFSATGHDHSGTTNGNLIPTAGIEDNAITAAKTEQLPQLTDRQDDTTDNSVTDQNMQIGWGWKLGVAAESMTETVTFPNAYDSAPVVLISSLGFKTTDPDSIDDFDTNSATIVELTSISTTGFTAFIATRDAGVNLNTGRRYGYSWMAIGTIAR